MSPMEQPRPDPGNLGFTETSTVAGSGSPASAQAKTQRYGDLEIGFVGLESDWPTGRPGHPGTVAIFSSIAYAPDGLWGPGNYVGPKNLKDTHGAMCFRDLSSDKSLLRSPVRWERLGDLPDTDVDQPQHRCALFRPIPPDGYVALGDIAARRDIGPQGYGGYADTMCVKKTHNGRNYVRQAECGKLLYEANGWKLWSIVTPPYPDGDLDEHLLLPTGCFTAVKSSGQPAPTPVTWILDLPAVIEKREGPEIPTLTSHDRPPAQTVIADRIVTVPYFMVKDDARDDQWKRENSPFYRILRKRHYELVLFRDNRNGSEMQSESQEVTHGVTKEKSEIFSLSTGVTVGVEVGVAASAELFGVGSAAVVKTSVSTTIETGYESRHGVSTMRQETKNRGLNIPRHKSACLWMEKHTLVTMRGNGDSLGVNASLDFLTDYYVTGEYPKGSSAEYVEGTPGGALTTGPTRRLAPGPTARGVTTES